MKFSRSWAIAVWAAIALISDAASAQSFPSRPITVIMPFAGGSASDVVSRVLFNKMATILGQPIVVENKPGAGGNLGTALAAMAAPDGYTLVGAASGPMAANLTLYKELGYDPQKDLVLISPFASFTIVVTASKKLGVTTLKDLIERARKSRER
jgi:tripartite-type tricarboxylate transporter receptor subunit TctC